MRLIFMGTPDLAVPTLAAVAAAGHDLAAVVTQPDRPAGRGRKLRPCPVAIQAAEMGLPLLQPEKVADASDDLAALQAEAAVVVAYGQVLPQAILDLFPRGAINVHLSLLPQLRGAAPINRAILQGLDRTGVSTMFMDSGLDTGDVIQQAATPISPDDTAGSLAERLAAMGAEIIVPTLAAVAGGEAPRTPQDRSRATYAPKLQKSEGRINWARRNFKIDRQVRGLDPWPAAFTPWREQTLKLFGPTALDPANDGAAPGQVIPPRQGRDDLLWVACREGSLGIGRIQAPGKKVLAAPDFSRGARLAPGDSLGP